MRKKTSVMEFSRVKLKSYTVQSATLLFADFTTSKILSRFQSRS